jgi:glycogen synthase
MNAQFAVVGSGDAWCEEALASLSARYPSFKTRVGYDEALAHLVEAGSDFFLMPSRYEPCGLNQLYSLRYGTLPIVHRTGGLADTVENYVQETGDGTGFMFDDLTPRALFNTIGSHRNHAHQGDDARILLGKVGERIYGALWARDRAQALEVPVKGYSLGKRRKQKSIRL